MFIGVIFTLIVLNVFFIILWKKCIKRRCKEKISTEETPLQSETDVKESTTIEQKNIVQVLKHKIRNKVLEKEFSTCPLISIQTTWEGLRSKNINKNRKKQNYLHLPYDFNRVILQEMVGVGTDDYINASYIKDDNRLRAYIACQSPKFNTVRDFWRMVWQENVELIIMATNFIENEIRMCAEYWPQNQKSFVEYGSIIIKLVKNEEQFEYYNKQTLEVFYRNEKRIINHICLKWDLDFKYPLYPNHFLPVIKEIREFYQKSSQILIHSGYGINRTGTLILCGMALQKIEMEHKVNFYDLTIFLREQRHNAITTQEYYVLAHLIVLEYLKEQSYLFEIPFEAIKAGDKISYAQEELENQLNYMKEICEFDEIIQSWSQSHTGNISTYADGYGKRKKYLIVSQPNQKNLLGEFWMSVANSLEAFSDHSCDLKNSESSVICISFNILEQVKFPYSNQYNNFMITVKCLESVDKSHYILTKIWLSVHDVVSKKIQLERRISLYELKKDKKDLTVSINNFLNLICDTKNLTQQQIVVTCNDRLNSSGIFIIMSYIIDKYEKEFEIDVCTAIRTVRRSGISYIQNLEQLRFLYACITEYLKKFKHYSYVM